GNYTVSLIVITVSGATDTAVHTIHINPKPIASFTVLTNCSLDSVYFTSTSTISSGNIVSYNWNFGDASTSTVQNPVHKYASTGTYVVTLNVTSDSGCTATVSDTVKFVRGIFAGFTSAGDCKFEYAFHDTSFVPAGDSIIKWQWSFGDGGTDTVKNPVHTYTASGTYSVFLTVTTAGGCSRTVSNSLVILPHAIADFTPKEGTYYMGYEINFTDHSSNAVSWHWNFGDGASDTIADPQHTYTVQGTMDVMLVVTNSVGCLDTVNYYLVINPATVGVPSAFTPNGDGVNDILYVRGGLLKEMDWRIYNEWGNELFHATSQDQGWDGKYRGQLQSATRYIYTLKATTYSGEEINMKGNVTILR
ncbi:MAG TPA: PKD domain-containing protein, partial [Bacteroidia bacterium]